MADVRNNTGERSLDEAAVRHAFLAIIDCIIGSGFTRDKRSHKDMTDDCHGNCIATPENRPADRSAARILRRCGSRDPHRGACAGTLWRARLCPARDRAYPLGGGWNEGDGKSVVEGKSVSVRLDRGGRRHIKKKTKKK